MTKRLAVPLPPGWGPADDPCEPPGYDRAGGVGLVQVSVCAECLAGQVPDPTPDDLAELARDYGLRHGAGEMVETDSGPCRLGHYGSAVFRSADFPRTGLWFLSDGRDFVLVTHVCPEEPGAEEVAEVAGIVANIALADDGPELPFGGDPAG